LLLLNEEIEIETNL